MLYIVSKSLIFVIRHFLFVYNFFVWLLTTKTQPNTELNEFNAEFWLYKDFLIALIQINFYSAWKLYWDSDIEMNTYYITAIYLFSKIFVYAFEDIGMDPQVLGMNNCNCVFLDFTNNRNWEFSHDPNKWLLVQIKDFIFCLGVLQKWAGVQVLHQI